MRDDNKVKVYGAVRTCLHRCYGASNPLVQATQFVDQLRCDPTWQDQEVNQVESMVLGAVKVIVRQPFDGCCHGDPPPSHSAFDKSSPIQRSRS